VRDLLDFARESPSTKESLDINEVIRQTVRLIGNRKRLERVTVSQDLSDSVPMVYGDKNQLEQVLLNLSLNACEAMPNGGELTISTLAREGKVLVKVHDNGCGISDEHIGQIFEPFFTTKPPGEGTGLGLSVSYGIVQQHGGSLEVESEEGEGTVFTMALPGAQPTSSEHSEGEADK
jgi:two-component system NtrC family sensor kinase